jgi:transcriptional regulator with XRE-family HTH domain
MGKELGKLRIDNDETINTMGQRLGVHPSTLRMYEGGQRLPDQDFFRQIKQVYGVDMSRFYIEPHKSPSSVLGRFMMLPDAELEAIKQIFQRNSIPAPRIVLRAIAMKKGEVLPERSRAATTKIAAKPLGKVALTPAPAKDVDGVGFVDDDEIDELDLDDLE